MRGTNRGRKVGVQRTSVGPSLFRKKAFMSWLPRRAHLVCLRSPALALTLVGASRFDLIAQSVPASVVTNKAEYLLGETVSIAGAGFAAGEVVTLQVAHADGGAEIGGGHGAFTVAADEHGAFSATWALGVDLVGHNFALNVARAAADPPLTAIAPVSFRRVAVVGTDEYNYLPGETATSAAPGSAPVKP